MSKLRQTFALILLLLFAATSHAQFQGYSSPQGVTLPKILNAVTTAQTVTISQNLGQTIHFVTYSVANVATAIDIRMDGSYDGSTWFAVSDDATDLVQGEVVAVGSYPYLRLNLVTCGGCGGPITLTANYSGTSSTSPIPYGFYNASQQVRKVVFSLVTSNATHTTSGIACPFGSEAGFIYVTGNETLAGGASLSLSLHVGEGAFPFSFPLTNGAQTLSIATPSTPCTTLDITYNPATTNAALISVYFVFYASGIPSSGQPATVKNSEATSAANAAVSTTIANSSCVQRPTLYSVSGRCSAGTAQLTVTDSGTQIWSSGTTEVGTSTFRFQWNPGLTGQACGGAGIVVTLSTCGAANTGTLDVQASVF